MSADPSLHPLLTDLDELARELERGTRPAAMASRQLATAAAFSTRRSVLWGTITLDRALIAVVLEGHKEIVHGGQRRMLHPADILVAAADVRYEATTVPDRRPRSYRTGRAGSRSMRAPRSQTR